MLSFDKLISMFENPELISFGEVYFISICKCNKPITVFKMTILLQI